MLQRLGCTTAEATDGDEVVPLLHAARQLAGDSGKEHEAATKPFNVLLMDIQMKRVCSSWHVARTVRHTSTARVMLPRNCVGLC